MTNPTAQHHYFGSPITRQIWGDLENVILIYVGSAADFALNAENEWLFYTNSLPAHPQRRFIETFSFNRKIFMASNEEVVEIMQKIRDVHTAVEHRRQEEEQGPAMISNKAFIEVGDMLIDYGIKGYEYLHHHKLSANQKEAYFQDMKKMFTLMHVQDTDENYSAFCARRMQSIRTDLNPNIHTKPLYESYERDMGRFRFLIFRQLQAYFADGEITRKLNLQPSYFFRLVYVIYPYIRNPVLFRLLLRLFLKKETLHMLQAVKRVG